MRSNRFTLLQVLSRPDRRRGELHPARSRGSGPGRRAALSVAGGLACSLVLLSTAFAVPASAAQKVQLGTVTPFAVLGASAVTDIPTSAITGDVGLTANAGTGYTGLTKAEVTGTIYATNATGPAGDVDDPALLTQASSDLTTAYNAAAGQTPVTTFTTGDNQLGGQTLTAGVYAFGGASTANLVGGSPLVLNGGGDPDAVFVFQASSTLVTGTSSVVELENGAQACNVFWDVGSSATLGSSSTFVGTVMAVTSASLGSTATVEGRILAETGAVTLDADTITAPSGCTVAASTSPTTTAVVATAATTGTGSSTGATGSASGNGAAAATGSSAGGTSGSTASTTSGVVPVGFPHTGLGGAAHARYDDVIALGVAALVGSAGAFGLAYRRRRPLQRGVGTSG